MSKRVEIILGKDGSIKVEATGFKGSSCKEATEFLDSIVGDADETELKDSYHESDKLVQGLSSGFCG